MEKTLVLLLLFFCISTGTCSWTRNASFLQDMLLTNMNVHVRPKEQTVINVTFVLTSLNKLDTVLQELWTTFLLHMTWTDQRLTWEPHDGEPEDLVFYVKDIWTPPLVVSNAVQDAIFLLRDDDTVPMRVTNNGTVTWVPRVSPVTTCDIDISKFPLDVQICHINITSWVHSVSELDLIQAETYRYKKAVNLDLYNDQAWDLFEATVQSQHVSRSSDSYFKNMQYTLYFRRHERFYWILLIIPFCCISFLMALVFLVPSKFQDLKVSYSVTLLLSFQLYLSLLQTLLPPVFNEGKSHILGDYVAAAMGYGTAITGLLTVQLVIVYLVKKMHKMTLVSGSITGKVIANESKTKDSTGNQSKSTTESKTASSTGNPRTYGSTCTTDTVPAILHGTVKGTFSKQEEHTINMSYRFDNGNEQVYKNVKVHVYSHMLSSHAIISKLSLPIEQTHCMILNAILTCPGKMVGDLNCAITGIIVDNEIRDGTIKGQFSFGIQSLAKLPTFDFISNFICFVILFIVYIASLGHFMAKLRE